MDAPPNVMYVFYLQARAVVEDLFDTGSIDMPTKNLLIKEIEKDIIKTKGEINGYLRHKESADKW